MQGAIQNNICVSCNHPPMLIFTNVYKGVTYKVASPISITVPIGGTYESTHDRGFEYHDNGVKKMMVIKEGNDRIECHAFWNWVQCKADYENH